jgi:hypothetical protein
MKIIAKAFPIEILMISAIASACSALAPGDSGAPADLALGSGLASVVSPIAVRPGISPILPEPEMPLYTWVQTDAGGCATGISVGPNNIPYVLGCESGVEKGVYYLQRTNNCSLIGCSHAWHYTQGAGVQVTVNLNGDPWILNSNGAVFWALDGDGNTPIDRWEQFTPFNETVRTNIGGCLTALAVPSWTGGAPEDFVTDLPRGDYFAPAIWGLGCGGAGDNGVWTLPINWDWHDGKPHGSTTWSPVDPGDGNAAGRQIVLFTDSGTNSQTIWLRKSDGSVLEFAGGTFAARILPFGGAANDLTDHFALLRSHGVYQWNDSALGWSTTLYASRFAPNGHAIIHIAYSGPINNTTAGTIGPSQLWGVDDVGNVYYTVLSRACPPDCPQ